MKGDTMKRGGMRKSTRRELRKLRELARFLLVGKRCCFCTKAILRNEEAVVEYGNADGPVLEEEVSIHHSDGDHQNNQHDNLTLAHRACHKAHHAREQRAKEKQMSVTTDDLKQLADTFDRLRAKKANDMLLALPWSAASIGDQWSFFLNGKVSHERPVPTQELAEARLLLLNAEALATDVIRGKTDRVEALIGLLERLNLTGWQNVDYADTAARWIAENLRSKQVGGYAAVDLRTELRYRLKPCDHNEMVATGDSQHAWKCAKCGYVYGQ